MGWGTQRKWIIRLLSHSWQSCFSSVTFWVCSSPQVIPQHLCWVEGKDRCSFNGPFFCGLVLVSGVVAMLHYPASTQFQLACRHSHIILRTFFHELGNSSSPQWLRASQLPMQQPWTKSCFLHHDLQHGWCVPDRCAVCSFSLNLHIEHLLWGESQCSFSCAAMLCMSAATFSMWSCHRPPPPKRTSNLLSPHFLVEWSAFVDRFP